MNIQKQNLIFDNQNFIQPLIKQGFLQKENIETVNFFKDFKINLVPPKCFNSNFEDNKWVSINYNKSRSIESINFDSIPKNWILFVKTILCIYEQIPKYGQQHIKSYGSYQNHFSNFKHFFNHLEFKNISSLKEVTEDHLREILMIYSKNKTKTKINSYLYNIQQLYELGPHSYKILHDGLVFNPKIDYFLVGTAKNGKNNGETEILDEELARTLISDSIDWVINKKEDIKNLIELSEILKIKKEEITEKNNRIRHVSLTHVQAKKGLMDSRLGYDKIISVRKNFGKNLIDFLEKGHQNSVNDISPEIADFMKILLIYKKLFSMYQAAIYVVCAAFTGWRASELFSIKLENLKETSEGFQLGTFLIKTTSNKEELIYRPIPEIVAQSIRNLSEINQLADGLIENKMVKTDVDKSFLFKTSLGNPTDLKSLNEDLKIFGKYIIDEKFNISTHQFRRFFAHFYVRRYKGTADAVRWHFRHISKDMILHYTSQALNAKQLASSKKELANDIANQILNNGDYKALSIENRLSDIKLEAKVLAVDEAGKYIQNKIEEELIDLHAMEWGYCVFQKNNKGAACEAKTGPIESRSEPSTCGKCKFLCTGKENIEFWKQSILLHQDITQNKFVTPLMKKESDKMITIGINILNKHQEKE